MSNPYSLKFLNLPRHRLVEIIAMPADFDSEAVEAARLELERRQVPEDEIASIRKNLSERLAAEQRRNEQVEAQRDKAKGFVFKWFKELFDLRAEKSHQARISIISLILGILVFVKLFNTWDIYLFYLQNPSWLATEMFLDILLLGAGTFFFSLRKAPGWTLLNLWLIYSLFISCLELAASIQGFIWDSHFAPSFSGALFRLLMFVGLLYYLHRPYMKDIFNVQRRVKWILIPALAIGAYFYLPFLWQIISIDPSDHQNEYPASKLNSDELPEVEPMPGSRINPEEIPPPANSTPDTVMRIEVE